MHDIWNPWHSCAKCDGVCEECHLFHMDKLLDSGRARLYRTMANFSYPLRKNANGEYRIRSGEMIRTCLSADFFHEKADKWRGDAWSVIRRRNDVIFMIPTKRPERIMECLPEDWGDGWENVFLNVVCEDQRRVSERVPVLLELPFKHKGLMMTPLIGQISVQDYLKTGKLERVVCAGEVFNGARPCDYKWAKKLRDECEACNVTFCFYDTGAEYMRDGRTYRMAHKGMRNETAYKTGLNFEGAPVKYLLFDQQGREVPASKRYVPLFISKCEHCAEKLICNGYYGCPICDGAKQSDFALHKEQGQTVGFSY